MTDDYKKRLKEIADKISNSQSAQSITTTQTPKTSTSTKTATTATNKSGTVKNTSAIIKEPKRETYSWIRDNPFSEEVDRSFFEGFYEVDLAGDDQERKKRMAQVDEALKDLRNRRAADMLRSTKNIFQSAKDNAQSTTAPRTEFHTKNNMPVPNTFLHKKMDIYDKFSDEQYYAPYVPRQSMSVPAYEYTENIVKNIFNNARSLGVEGNGLPPVAVSELKAARERLRIAENMNKGEMAVKGLIGEGVDLLIGNKLKGVSIGEKTFSSLIKERIEDIPKDIILDWMKIPSIGDIVKESLPNFTENDVKDAGKYLKAVEQGDQKYLINGYFQRKEFISQLEKAAEQVKNTPKFGYLSQRESDELKEKVLARLNKIIQMNRNYQYEKDILDSQWEKIKKQ